MAQYKRLNKINDTVIVPDDEAGVMATSFIVHYAKPITIREFINQVQNDEMPSIRIEVLEMITKKRPSIAEKF